MKPVRAFLTSTAVLALSASQAQGEVLMQFSTGAAYTQSGPFTVNFRGGDLNVNLRDGNAILSPCIHPSPFIIPPNPLLCPLGTTGFIALGDLNGDGVRDDGSFWSISEVIPAFIIEPFRPDKSGFVAGPPSFLPRPLFDFADQGAVIFYNVLTENVLQYDVSIYEMARIYAAGAGGRALMKNELVLGQYVFTYPLLNAPDTAPPVAVPVTYAKMPEGLDPSDLRVVQEQQFRYTNLNWDGSGNLLFDPFLTNFITWTGNNAGNTIPGVDQLRLSMLDPTTVGVPGVDEVILFPPSQTPLLILNPQTQEYILPPFFFAPGDNVVLRLRMDRTLGSNAVSFDTSVRLFEVNLRYVQSYQGFSRVAFPVGTSDVLRQPGADFDGDGQSNVYEFGLQSDPADIASVSVPPAPVQLPDGRVRFTLTKRPNAVARYSFSVSDSGGAFVNIKASNPDWEITTDDDTILEITTRGLRLAADFASQVSVVPRTLTGGI